MSFLKKNKPLVGLDIGSSAIKAVELTQSKNGYQLTGFAYEPLEPDAVVDGAIMDAPTVAESIKRTFLIGKLKPKAVATGVSGHSVIVKRVVVPAATPNDVDASIQWDAEQYIPFDISEVNLDYQIVGPPWLAKMAGWKSCWWRLKRTRFRIKLTSSPSPAQRRRLSISMPSRFRTRLKPINRSNLTPGS